MKAMIWGIRYTPFVMGGRVNQEVKSEIECKALVELGQGYKGYVFQSKDGKWRVAESTSGALVGSGKTFDEAISMVVEDVRTGDPKIMKRQVDSAVEQSKKISQIIPEEEFLGMWGTKKK